MERDGQYANVRDLPKRPNQGGVMETTRASAMEPRSLDRSSGGLGDWMGQIGPNSVDFQEHGSVTLDVFVIRIVPKDYDLCDSLELAAEVRRRRRQREYRVPRAAL